MDIKQIKYNNFLRLAREKKDDEPARLARILGTSTQHASQLLLNKVGIRPKTIKKLCAAWGISENEFVTDPQNTNKGGSVTELSEDWQMKMIIEQIGKRIDDVVKVMSRYKDESDRLWKELHTLKESDVSIIVYSLVSFIFPSIERSFYCLITQDRDSWKAFLVTFYPLF